MKCEICGQEVEKGVSVYTDGISGYTKYHKECFDDMYSRVERTSDGDTWDEFVAKVKGNFENVEAYDEDEIGWGEYNFKNDTYENNAKFIREIGIKYYRIAKDKYISYTCEDLDNMSFNDMKVVDEDGNRYQITNWNEKRVYIEGFGNNYDKLVKVFKHINGKPFGKEI